MKKLNLKNAIAKKSKFLAKIPFFISLIRKLVHEDEINECLDVCGHLQGIEFANGVMSYFNAKVEVTFSSEINLEGRYIFASNHPLGGLDGVAFISAVGKKFEDLKFPVNDFLLEIENLNPIFLPVNKVGKQNREVFQLLNKAYESDSQILIFPSGYASRKRDGIVKDLPWQKHFIQKSVQSKRDVIPVHIDGQNSRFFYLVDQIREFLGIKFNIEMALLPHEMFKQKGKTLRIKFGEPIPYSTFDKTKTPTEWAEFVHNRVYSM